MRFGIRIGFVGGTVGSVFAECLLRVRFENRNEFPAAPDSDGAP